MPDPKKLKVLEDAKYEVREVCLSCEFFAAASGTWGSCAKHASRHSKHTDGARLSTRSDGWCPSYRASAVAQRDLERSGFLRFLKR